MPRSLLLPRIPVRTTATVARIAFVWLVHGLAGCGLVIDAQPEPDASLGARDGAPLADSGTIALDGSSPDSGPLDAGPPDAGCFDADADGVTDCAGDCDDASPTVYPGAPTICGDGVSNDCSSTNEETICAGLGTFVSATRGDDAFPGTQAMPVRTIAEGIAHATTIGGGVDVYVAEGDYAENVAMVEGVSLLGGHDSSTWVRDPRARASIITALSHMGVSVPSGVTRVTELDGFVVNGADGFTAAAITVSGGASPVVRACVINGPTSTGASYGVLINPGNTGNAATPLIERCAISLGGSRAGWGPDTGAWGVLALRTAVEVRDSSVTLAAARTIQRGIEVFDGPPGALVVRNVVRGAGTSESAFGVRFGSGSGRIEANDVHPGQCSAYCFGIALEGNLASVVVANNVAFAGDGTTVASAAFTISFEATPTSTPDVVVHSNFFAAGAPSGGTTAGVSLVLERGTPLTVGRFYDNILRAGVTSGFAFAERSYLIDPAVLSSNALFAPRIGSTVARLYLDEGAMALPSATAINALPGARNNVEHDCGHLAPAPGSDLHLAASSPCIDAGDAGEAPATDYEGDPRTIGAAPDIGPDEHAP